MICPSDLSVLRSNFLLSNAMNIRRIYGATSERLSVFGA